ncbi:aminotransferase class III-fold pyridoxal phosphate-dependent enzyme [Maribellus maritimus]|uniref:aminotransferase class III-fold pyridoxal phosphate-dependent enzyme n=1 Tax=Maribellus maritimus TaxID=2870838 RepID=UPI001EE9E32E|nr:aminotransferase class III-fold pyridoxal phosphate-dependent enzyme [Maribellus maritimus]MCG6190474.1 aminotransferase class III-fold pyridoxal phosphate-dependent enzyme [Maribellus maritimus]
MYGPLSSSKKSKVSIFIQLKLNEFKQKISIVGDVRGIGFFCGIELVKNRATKEKATEEAEKIMYDCYYNGLSFNVSQGNLLTLAPTLTMSKEEMQHAFLILENAFQK